MQSTSYLILTPQNQIKIMHIQLNITSNEKLCMPLDKCEKLQGSLCQLI